MLQVVFEKVSSSAILPTKGSSEAACWDVYAAEKCSICPNVVISVSTKLRVKIPKGYMLHIVPRSGLAFKEGIITMGGIIDSDYRGELKIGLTRISPKRYKVRPGDRIAQIQLHPVPKWECIEGEVDIDTERGNKGFGSTGDSFFIYEDCRVCKREKVINKPCWYCNRLSINE